MKRREVSSYSNVSIGDFIPKRCEDLKGLYDCGDYFVHFVVVIFIEGLSVARVTVTVGYDVDSQFFRFQWYKPELEQ